MQVFSKKKGGSWVTNPGAQRKGRKMKGVRKIVHGTDFGLKVSWPSFF